jgi:hypothetical protein
MGRHHHPKTHIVVGVVRVVVVAVRTSGVMLIIDKRTAAQYLPGSLTNRSRRGYYTTTVGASSVLRFYPSCD